MNEEMKKYITLIIVLIIIIAGLIRLGAVYCSFGQEINIGKINTNKNQLVFDVSKSSMDKISFSDLFSEVEIVSLETTKNSMIGEIFTVRIFNDTIFVFDKNIAKGIFLFNINGRFIKKIGKLGKGPGEYIYPEDFNVNIKDRTVSFLDIHTNKIIKYDFNGKHIIDIQFKNKFSTTFFTEWNNLCYIYPRMSGKGVSHDLYSIDCNGNLVNKWFKLPEFNKGWISTISPMKTCFYNDGKSIKFWDYFNDTIFSINKDGIIPYVSINSDDPIGENTLSDLINKLGTNNPRLMQEIRKKDQYFGISAYLENSKMIYMWYNKGFNAINLIYNKSTNRFIETFLVDDITQLPISPFESCTEKYFINYLHRPEDINSLKNNKKNNTISSCWKNKDVLDKLNIDNNPIILLYKLK